MLVRLWLSERGANLSKQRIHMLRTIKIKKPSDFAQSISIAKSKRGNGFLPQLAIPFDLCLSFSLCASDLP